MDRYGSKHTAGVKNSLFSGQCTRPGEGLNTVECRVEYRSKFRLNAWFNPVNLVLQPLSPDPIG